MAAPLLTISLLCPGRTEDVFKTLDSLKPLLDRISSELIIVDTGCPEGFRKRLLTYTEKILPFSWTGDFSEARNVGIDAAKGEWFLFIDDDEWFEDVSGIVRFFNSGDYKHYTSATYIQRNYTDPEGKNYNDANAFRLFKLIPGCRFVSRIHEYYNGPSDCIFWLSDFVHHFGYVFDTEEKLMKHILRNIKPLRELISEDFDNIHAHYQLIQELKNLKNWEEMAEECRVGIELKKKGVEINNTHYSAFFIGAVMAAIYKFDYEAAVKSYEEAFSYNGLSDIAKARIVIMMMGVFAKLDMYEELRKSFEIYERLYKKYHGDARAIAIQECLFAENPFQDNNYVCYLLMSLVLAIRAEAEKEFKNVFDKIDKDIFYTEPNVSLAITEVVKLLCETNITAVSKSLMNQLLGLICSADSTEGVLRKELKEKAENEVLLNNLLDIESENDWLSYLKAIALIRRDRAKEALPALAKACEKDFSLFDFSDEVFDALAGISGLADLLNAIDRRKLFAFADRAIKKEDDRLLDRMNLLLDNLPEEDIRFTRLLKDMVEYQLVFTPVEEFAGYDDIIDVFKYWCELTLKQYVQCFKPEIFVKDVDLLPEDGEAAVKINTFMAVADKDQLMALKSLKSASTVYADIAKPIKALTELYIKRMSH